MTYKIPLFLSFCLLLFSCPDPNRKNTDPTAGGNDADTSITKAPVDKPVQKEAGPFILDIPAGHTLLGEASGDLDKDGVDENVVVFNTDQTGDFGAERVLLVFKAQEGEWKLWERAYGAVRPGESGGVFGDPFQSVAVERGAVVIHHYGGSRIRWDHTHRFRYQNDNWELIGATMVTGAPCDWEETFDYNLASGNVVYKRIQETCKNGEDPTSTTVTGKANFKYKLKKRPVMNGFNYEEVYAVNPYDGACYPEETCYAYQEMIRGKKTKSAGLWPASLADLQGIYALGGHDESWALHIKCDVDKDDQFYCRTTYYTIDGMLPPEEDKIPEAGKPRVLNNFQVDFTDLTFDSDLGKGKIALDASQTPSITFFAVKSHVADQLVMERVLGYSYPH